MQAPPHLHRVPPRSSRHLLRPPESQHPGADLNCSGGCPGNRPPPRALRLRQSVRSTEASWSEGTPIPEKAQITVAVHRPNRLSARSVSGLGERRMVADGRTLTVFDRKPNHYAKVPMATNIDGVGRSAGRQVWIHPATRGVCGQRCLLGSFGSRPKASPISVAETPARDSSDWAASIAIASRSRERKPMRNFGSR